MAHLILARHVLCGQHTDHAGKGFGLLRADILHQRPRVFGPHRAAVDHSRQVHLVHVVHVLAGAEHLALHVDAVHPGADLDHLLLLIQPGVLPQHFCRQLNGVDNLLVARAPAVVVADGVGDLHTAGVGIHIQQPLGADHHAGNTKTALYCSRLTESVYIHILFTLAEPLHGENVLSLHAPHLLHAGLGGFSVHQHRTGSAGALAAAVLHGL